MTFLIVVLGGVSSSLGKGIFSASLAKLLQSRGYSVVLRKFDPYLNIDPGTLNPYEHGECYVTEDGAETDLDLGHYERFLDCATSKQTNVTMGQIYKAVIENERQGKYLGKTVQVVPHVTDEIKRQMCIVKTDMVITEIGGTVGDIESLPFLEAIRQLKWEKPKEVLVIHLTLIPYLSSSGELKTKPTQHSVKKLQEAGLMADILVCRTEHALGADIKKKIALFCNVSQDAVIEARDAKSIYEVPLLMEKEKVDQLVLTRFGLPVRSTDLGSWERFVDALYHPTQEVSIGLIGKYTDLKDAYKSIHEAFVHAGVKNQCAVRLHCLSSEELTEENVSARFQGLRGIVVAPGFGSRGIPGKLAAIRYAREQKVPFLGICLGMQCAVIEFARNVLHRHEAHSTEMDEKTPFPVIDVMESQKQTSHKGGTMRLGSYSCQLEQGSKAFILYDKKKTIQERHRHRYEFHSAFHAEFEQAGFKITGRNLDTGLAEIVELEPHPWFIGVQFHPEYKSTVATPHPLFVDFVRQCIQR